MTNRNINKHLKSAIDSTPIGLLDRIKNEPVEKMKEHDYITRQIETKKTIPFIKPVLSIASAAAVFLIAYFGWYMPYMMTDSIVYLDVNPSIEMSINGKEQVIDLEGLNKEGKELIEEINYKRKDINGVLNDILDRMLKEGYVDETNHAMLVSVLNEDIKKGNNQVYKLNEAIGEYFMEKEIKPIVLRQSVASTNTIEDYAERYNISVGKMTFIKNLIILNPDFQLEELVDLSIEELIKLSRNNGLDLSKIVDIDEELLEEELEDDDRDELEDYEDNEDYIDDDDDWDDDDDDGDDDDDDDNDDDNDDEDDDDDDEDDDDD